MPTSRTIPWPRFIAEFVVIVVGVLVALAVDSWREQLQERALGQEHLRGLLTDLAVDSAMLTAMGEGLTRKQTSLDVLLEASWGSIELTPDSVAELLFPSALYGWRIPAAQNAAYEELKSTGTLRLLSDPELRSQVVGYYENWEHQLERLDRHRSNYPNTVYRLAPPTVLRRGVPVGRESADLLSRLRTREMRDQLNHEANFTSLLANRQADFQQHVATLLTQIRANLR